MKYGKSGRPGLRLIAGVILAVVAACGAVLSYRSLYVAAVPTFGRLAYGFPVLVDALVLGASLQYVAGVRAGRPRPGWRWTAHAGVAGTVALNALAAPTPGAVPWHVTAPLVWSVLVELTARDALGDWRAEHRVPQDRIPGRLWLTAPVESARTWLRMARMGVADHGAARTGVGVHAAAVEALRLSLPHRSGREVRRVLARQLRAGSLAPVQVLDAIGWSGGQVSARDPGQVLRSALAAVLAGGPGRPLLAAADRTEAAPVAPREHAPVRSRGATGKRRRAAPGPVEDLPTAAARIAAELRAGGALVSRRRLADGLRDAGHKVGSDRITELITGLDDGSVPLRVVTQ